MSTWENRIFVDGWVPGEHGELEISDASTGEPISSAGWAGPGDVEAAANSVQSAARIWTRMSASERADGLSKLEDNIGHCSDELSYWLIREAGATFAKAQREIRAAQAEVRYMVEVLRSEATEKMEILTADRQIRVIPEAVGVVSVITPFNAPLVLAMRAIAPAIAYGNGVILKPDPRTAISGGLLFPALFTGTGIPEGLLSVLPGHGDVGSRMADHALVGSVLFTGSTRVGRAVGEVAGRNFKRVGLELGGNNPVLVLDDADIDSTVDRAITSSFLHSGQICMTAGQYYVAESIHDDFVEAFAERAKKLSVGNPWTDRHVDMGPVIDDPSAKRIQDMIDSSIAKGAVLKAGGKNTHRMIPATVLSQVPDDAVAWCQEVFGPVAAIQPMRSIKSTLDVLSKANYGLVAAIHSADGEKAHDIASRLIVGSVRINDVTNYDNPRTPMVGRKESGNMSAFGGAEMRELLTVPKVISHKVM